MQIFLKEGSISDENIALDNNIGTMVTKNPSDTNKICFGPFVKIAAEICALRLC